MRIAYSCAGEGFGHAGRMVALYDDLKQYHEVLLYIPETVSAFVASRLPRAAVRSIPCFTFIKNKNRVEYIRTVFYSLRQALHFFPAIKRLSRQLVKDRIQAVLSDFDPYLPWAARLVGIPVIQMNHPGIIRRYLTLDPRTWVAALVAFMMEGPWDWRLHVSFFGGDIGPVLRKALLAKPVRNEAFLAVNLKIESRKDILPLLDAIPGLTYRLYPAPGADFDEGLRNCTAVITNGGHQTLSEALVLGKPVLAIPQRGQAEQELNARMLQQSGRGLMVYDVRELGKVLPRFLASLEQLRRPAVIPVGFRFKDSRQELINRLNAILAAYDVPVTATASRSEAIKVAV
ncbi:glycosyltransferase family protein [Gracilinema caldarium]|uniref:Glycosyltransferase 28 domain protein n=1 Tax=Gracilinema caldarium (strain ATCC 51460 / DSM 7334 / H1) TaxID=744872 RepID=F8F271_GRAC1|nr:glycosyltransferase family protein [Gracilinema caldarium]AEJ20343.1 Glycosyltransferase 28 domain protein [Gracilinema caldarium DSM 7334]